LGDRAVLDILHDGFTSTGRDLGTTAGPLVRFAEGHPQRAMQLADALWRATDEGATADEIAWGHAVATVRAEVDNGSERLFELIPPGSQRVLRAVASGGSIYGAAADVLGLAPGTARSAADVLVGNGYLARRGTQLVTSTRSSPTGSGAASPADDRLRGHQQARSRPEVLNALPGGSTGKRLLPDLPVTPGPVNRLTSAG